MKWRIFVLVLVIFFFKTAAWSQMQVSGISIAADSSEFDNEHNTLVLIGNVQLIYKGYYLSSDKATLYRESKKVIAESRVVLQTIDTYIEADKADFNLDSQTGTFYNGFIQSGKVIFEGDVIKKLGDKNYEATNASYTACNTCPPAWSFSGSLINAELGGYADIRVPLLKVANVPIFILPRILVPLKSERQSGFLAPSLGFGGNHGFTVVNSYFWAIDRSSDLTLSALKYEKRGWKGHGHYRYILDKNSRGELVGAYLYDQGFKDCVKEPSECAKFKDYSSRDIEEQKVDRGYVSYTHYYLLPNNFIHRTKGFWLSDLRYIRDFVDELEELNGQSAYENKMSITKNTEDQNFSGEISFYTNLLKADPFSGNEESVHRLPDLRYSVMEQRIAGSNFLFSMDLRYTNFNRNNFSYDDICSDDVSLGLGCNDNNTNNDPIRTRIDEVRDGKFDPGVDLIRTGQRLDVAPQISYPLLFGNTLSLLPSIKFRETQYRFNSLSPDVRDTAARRYLETNLSMRTRFSRLFGDVSNPLETSYKHQIEPEILLSQRPWVRRPNHVFFGDFNSQPYYRSTEKVSDVDLIGSDSDLYGLNKVQFDYEDRLFNKNLLTFKIENSFIRKSWKDGFPEYKNIFKFILSQSYDFNQLKRDKPEPWSNIDLLLRVNLDNFVIYSEASYYPYARVTDNTTRLQYVTDYNSFFELAYTQDFKVQEDNTFVFAERTEAVEGGIGFIFKYLFLKGTTLYNMVSGEYQWWRYQTVIKPPGECWSLEFSQRFRTETGDTETWVDFHFDFSGKTI
ncbi:MAG: LPS-assembly protein LptD [Bdellovibrionales bacterium]|nr:LPS-assembly protein LptD [Bdellovibrionales bacterium]